MNKAIYDIQINSIRAAVEHLHTIDLAGLLTCAITHGTDRDRALIAGVMKCLVYMPTGHP